MGFELLNAVGFLAGAIIDDFLRKESLTFAGGFRPQRKPQWPAPGFYRGKELDFAGVGWSVSHPLARTVHRARKKRVVPSNETTNAPSVSAVSTWSRISLFGMNPTQESRSRERIPQDHAHHTNVSRYSCPHPLAAAL